MGHIMTLQELKYIVALADCGHFGVAATHCHISQSTLSTQIKKLEDYLGAPLFDRSLKPIAPTAVGMQVIESARTILIEEQRIRELVKSNRDPMSRTVRLGAIMTLGAYYLPHALMTLQKHYPKLRLLLRENLTEYLLQDIHSGQLDAALVAIPVQDSQLEIAPIFVEPFVAALPPGHRLAKNKTVALAELAAEKLLLLEEGHCLRDQALEVCGLHSIYSEEVRATSLETLRQMVGLGIGSTLLPALAAPARTRHTRSPVEIRPLRSPGASRTIALVWRKHSPVSATLRAVSEMLCRYPPDGVGKIKP